MPFLSTQFGNQQKSNLCLVNHPNHRAKNKKRMQLDQKYDSNVLDQGQQEAILSHLLIICCIFCLFDKGCTFSSNVLQHSKTQKPEIAGNLTKQKSPIFHITKQKIKLLSYLFKYLRNRV